jgi:hypothetical protein
MSDPYTTGSMVRPVAGHAEGGPDSPDGGDLGWWVFGTGELHEAQVNGVGTRLVTRVRGVVSAFGNRTAP